MEKYTDSTRPSQDGIDSENATLLSTTSTSQQRQKYIYITFFNLFLFTVSTLSLVCAISSQKDTSTSSAAKLMDQYGIYSPAMHEVTYSHVKFTLPTPLNASKYVGTSSAVDDAWMDIARLPDQMVTLASLRKLHKDDTTALRVTDPRTGESGYRVGLEVFHQLHCLNLLRMATYPAHYEGVWWSDTNDEPGKVRAHLDHCVEILRMNLMCLVDVNVFTFQKREGAEGEEYWPDYESEHVCRDFGQVREWAVRNAVPDADV